MGALRGPHSHLAFNLVQVTTLSKVLFPFFPKNQVGLCSLPQSKDKINKYAGPWPAALQPLGSVLAGLGKILMVPCMDTSPWHKLC